MDRGAWEATVHGVARVRNDLAPPPSTDDLKGGWDHHLHITGGQSEGWGGLPLWPNG